MIINEAVNKVLVIEAKSYQAIAQYSYEGFENIESIHKLIMNEPNVSGESCIVVIPFDFTITEHYQELLSSINNSDEPI